MKFIILKLLICSLRTTLLYNDDGIIPVEVKASDNNKSKSLNVYMDKYKPKYGIRISTKNFGYENNIKSIPLYATFLIK